MITKKYNKNNKSKNNNKSKYILKSKKNGKSLKSSKTLNILSYNICWESMSGKDKNWTLCSNNTNPEHPKNNSVCVGNIADAFSQDNLDFITLQESTDFKKLIALSPILQKMKYEICDVKSFKHRLCTGVCALQERRMTGKPLHLNMLNF